MIARSIARSQITDFHTKILEAIRANEGLNHIDVWIAVDPPVGCDSSDVDAAIGILVNAGYVRPERPDPDLPLRFYLTIKGRMLRDIDAEWEA